MATEVLMPQMGESIAEGTITRWLAKVGDEVERDQPLFEISTDKVDAEIPSPATGTLLEVKYQEGDTVAVNELVAMIGEIGETGEAADVGAAGEAKPEEPAVETDPLVFDADALSIEPMEPMEPMEPTQPVRTAEPAAPAAPPTATGDESALAERVRTHSSPLVRKIAQEQDVDLSQVTGTGIHGRVTKDDLMAHLDKLEGAAPVVPASSIPRAASAPLVPATPSTTAPLAPRPTGGFFIPPYVDGDNVEIVPMSKIRQITAAHMTYSKATSAHVTTVFHIDMARADKARARAKRGFLKAHNTKLTYMPFIFKAVAAALKAHPKLNAAVDGNNIVYKKDIHIGMAVALDRGLIVPVIRHADGLSLVGLARAANDLADRARNKKLRPDEVQGGTFTVTNPGVFGSLFGTPIINQPQVAILGLGAIEKRPIVEQDVEGNDTITIKTMAYFAITYDHRLVDGADADHFMNHIKKTLADETWSELDAFM